MTTIIPHVVIHVLYLIMLRLKTEGVRCGAVKHCRRVPGSDLTDDKQMWDLPEEECLLYSLNYYYWEQHGSSLQVLAPCIPIMAEKKKKGAKEVNASPGPVKNGTN